MIRNMENCQAKGRTAFSNVQFRIVHFNEEELEMTKQ